MTAITPLHVRLFRVIVPVNDLQRAAAFYREILGAPGTQVSPGRWYFRCGDLVLACYDAAADGDAVQDYRHAEPLYFAVSDISAMVERCAAVGARFPVEAPPDVGPLGTPMRRPWGELSFYVEDPFGNMLCFVDAETAFVGE